jgi:hypothetical protein
MNDDERHTGWCGEFDYLYGMVKLLYTRTQMWEAIDSELVRTKQLRSGGIVEVFRPVVGESQGVVVRRLLDEDSRTRSIVRLLGQIAEHHETLTRVRFVDHWQPERRDEADKAFDAIAGVGKAVVPYGYVLQMRERIVTAGKNLVESINQIVAHDQREKTAQPFTWGQLERAIEGLSVEFIEIGRLLRGGSYYEPIPYLAPGWNQPFKHGLFAPGAPTYDTVHFIERHGG